MSKKQAIKSIIFASIATLALTASFATKAVEAYDDQLAKIDAQINLIRKQGELSAALAQSVGPIALSMPSVVSIMGMDGDLTARLMMPNGAVSTYKEGDIIRAGVTVAVITPKLVILNVGKGKKKNPVALEFMAGASPAMGSGAPGVGGGGNMPPIPPGLLPAPPVIQMMPTQQPYTPPAAPPKPIPVAQAAPAAPPAAAQPIAAAPPQMETPLAAQNAQTPQNADPLLGGTATQSASLIPKSK